MPIATPQGTLDFKSVDRVTFVGASSNTVIDTTTGSLGVGVDVNGPTSNLHVVGNTRLEGDINMIHTSNNSSMKVNSNVVTEFPRSKKLIKYPRVALTQNDESATSGYVASASSYYNTSVQPYEAFDVVNNGGLGWESGPNSQNGNGRYSSGSTFNTTYLNDNPTLGEGGFQTTAGSVTYTGEWVQIQLPVAIQSTTHVFGNSDDNSDWNLRIPQSGVILGSTNGSSWELIHSFDDTIKNATITVTHTRHYSYFRLVVLSVGTNQTLANVPEWELFGIPEYDPDADGVDVKVTSYPNVPNTDWLEVYYDAKDLTTMPSTVTDLSPSGTNDGVAFGDPQVSNGAFVFDGSGDYIRGQLTSFGGEKTLTFSLWFNMVEMVSGSNNSIFQIGSQGSSEEGLGFRVQTGSVFRMYTWGGPSNLSVGTVLPNTWYHAVGTYSGGMMTLYVDGNILQLTSGSSLDLPTNPYFALGVQLTSSGTEYSTSGFNGSIANFRLFNRALTSDEVWQLYSYQKEYFGHGDLSMTLKAGRLGIGTSEPKATLDIRGEVLINGYQLTSMYPGFATGGDDVYDIDGYRIHVFTTSGTFVVPGKDITTDILLVGGGGGGGQDNAGGGGAGGLIFKPGHTFVGRSTYTGRDGAYTVVIGSGGTGSTYQNSDPPNPGGDTYIRPLVWRSQSSTYGSTPITQGTFTNIFTAKGGGPGNNGGQAGASTINGGSGGGQDAEIRTGQGGGIATQPTRSGDSGTYGYGNNGGNSADQAGGGGGGAGKAGENGSESILGLYYGGYGGDGLSGASGFDFAEIFGTKYGEVVGEDVYFAGGGAGANRNVYTSFSAPNGYALGGKGGGGSAGGTPETNEDGLPGTGGGGAGATWVTSPNNYGPNLDGGNGGSGIVMIRYRL